MHYKTFNTIQWYDVRPASIFLTATAHGPAQIASHAVQAGAGVLKAWRTFLQFGRTPDSSREADAGDDVRMRRGPHGPKIFVRS